MPGWDDDEYDDERDMTLRPKIRANSTSWKKLMVHNCTSHPSTGPPMSPHEDRPALTGRDSHRNHKCDFTHW